MLRMILLWTVLAVLLVGWNEAQVWRPDNLAFLKPTGQVSTKNVTVPTPQIFKRKKFTVYHGEYGSHLAVNGDREPRFSRMSCSMTAQAVNGLTWWYVDLTDVYRILRVLFVNGVDQAELARNFRIVVGKSLNLADIMQTQFSLCAVVGRKAMRPGEVAYYRCQELCIGKYVVILKQGQESLQVCELEVYGRDSFENMALNKPIIMYSKYKADNSAPHRTGFQIGYRANDGHTNVHYEDNSCVHSALSSDIENEWLSVDLGEELRIRRITVVNRGDRFGEYLRKFKFRVTSDFHAWLFEKNQFLECYLQTRAMTDGEIVQRNCDSIIVGQFVLVYKMDAQVSPLLLCEIEVEASSLETNIALGKKTLMSGELDKIEHLSFRAVDGRVQSEFEAYSCIITPGKEEVEWWMVDLMEISMIRNVIVAAPGDQGTCMRPMGLSKKLMTITDKQISVSSHPERKTYGRLQNPVRNAKKDAWCSKPYQDEWFQVDFNNTVILTGVTIAGANPRNGWVEEVTVSYSQDGKTWQKMLDEHTNKTLVLHASPKDQRYYATAWFQREYYMKHIRIHPHKWTKIAKYKDRSKKWNRIKQTPPQPCMRLELHGCYEIAPVLEKFRVLVSKKFDPANYQDNDFIVCHQQEVGLPQASYKPLYCKKQVVGRYVIVEKRDAKSTPLNFCELEVYGSMYTGNLALSRETMQISTVGDRVSDLAVDGIKDSNLTRLYFRSRSCIKTDWNPIRKYNWWMVDLLFNYDVGIIVIINSDEYCGSCLKHFDVMVSKTFNESAPENGTLCAHNNKTSGRGEVLTLFCERNTIGRFVTVLGPGNMSLVMCELEAYERYNFGSNLAQAKPTYQSSGNEGYGFSHLGVDGVRMGYFNQGSCTMTCSKCQDAWWAVNLEAIYQIYRVAVTNRHDCCAERLRMFSIIVSKGFIPYGLNKLPTTLCYLQTAPLKAGETRNIYCQNSPVGDHVVLLKSDSYQEPLTVCEVEIYGRPYEKSIALGKKATQASDQKRPNAWKVVDGNASPNFYDGSCSSTTGKYSVEWWSVDMVMEYTFDRMIIMNRVDCCSEILRDYLVLTSMDPYPEDVTAAPVPASRVCSDRRSPELAGGDVVPIRCQQGSVGRYLTVYKEHTAKGNELLLCEVDVFGELLYDQENLAFRKPVLATTTGQTNLTDRNHTTQSDFCHSMADFERQRDSYWFTVDLLKSLTVRYVSITFSTRVKGDVTIAVAITDDPNKVRPYLSNHWINSTTLPKKQVANAKEAAGDFHLFMNNVPECGYYFGSLIPGQIVDVYCTKEVTARYVSVIAYRKGKEKIPEVCETEVFGPLPTEAAVTVPP